MSEPTSESANGPKPPSPLNAGPTSVSPAKADEKKHSDMPERVFLVSYPKIMFLYPTVLTAMFCAIVMWYNGGLPPEEVLGDAAVLAAVENAAPAEDGAAAEKAAAPVLHTYHHICARIFLLVLTVNLVVVAFDFPRTTSLTWFFAIVAVSVGLWTLFRLNEGLAPKVLEGLLSVRPAANASFYVIFTIGMLILFIAVLISRRFDYWEVKGNELLHHHGFLSDLERLPAPNLRIDKEINDVFEYMLLRSGRLILHPSNERRVIVLENVLFINRKEERITKMLGALQVRVRTDAEE